MSQKMWPENVAGKSGWKIWPPRRVKPKPGPCAEAFGQDSAMTLPGPDPAHGLDPTRAMARTQPWSVIAGHGRSMLPNPTLVGHRWPWSVIPGQSSLAIARVRCDPGSGGEQTQFNQIATNWVSIRARPCRGLRPRVGLGTDPIEPNWPKQNCPIKPN